MKIVAIVGSLRRDSYNHQLAKEAGKILGDAVEFELLDYSDVPFFNQDIESPTPDAVKRVRGIVQSADGIWFFSPEYNHFFPGVLKNLIDWLSRPIGDRMPPVLSGKPAAVSGITPGISGAGIAQDHLISLISFLNMKVMNQPRLTIPNAPRQMDQNKQLLTAVGAEFLEKQVQAFLLFLKEQN